MKCPICQQEAKIEHVNPLVQKVVCPVCHTYYVEMPFLSQLEAFETKYGHENYLKVLKEMQKKTTKNLVIFTADFDNPYLNIEEAIYLELEDLIGLAKIPTYEINSKLTYGS